MSKFNYYLQVILLISAAILAVLSILSKAFLIGLLSLQLIVGLLQTFVCVVLLLNAKTRSKELIIHLVLSGALVLILFLFGEKLWLLVFTLPWLMAINFCRLSYRLYRKKKYQRKAA